GHPDPQATAAALSALLKRVALLRHPRTAVAGLAGTAWLEFLDRTGPPPGEFCQGAGQVLLSAPYARTGTALPEALFDLARRWIEAQRAGR
ncbi:MAG: DUF4381 domain-containing protein, partial [Magnetococcales bacterium]|nr:DUF4381 domain-containing protein [Magnetococcales bacterium]